MKIFNSLTKKKEEFKPIDDKLVKIYSCGPTVYNYAHIGNFRTYINTDILRRYLEFSKYKIEQAMNITDVEDKIIREANAAGVDISEITWKFEKALFKDLKTLNVEKVEYYPHATEEIDSMITLVQGLLDKEIAYKSEDGSIYFSISKFKDYGKLSGLDTEGLKIGARVDQDEYDKDSAHDFVLWKAKKEGEPSWSAPFGEGRPGWHIECSAMSMKYLGETIDVHTGGVDLLFPHHENEIAQSEAFTNKKFVSYWFHGEFLLINGQKMSKSLHNIYTLEDIVNKYKVEPLAYRMLCLMSHYREKLNFTDTSIIQAQNTLNNLRDFILRLKEVEEEGKLEVNELIIQAKNEFIEAMDDDLNTPKALASLFDFIKGVNKLFVQRLSKESVNNTIDFILEIDKILGLDLNKIHITIIPENVKILVDKRDNVRKAKNWEESDKLRAEIEKQGFEVEDTPDGTKVRKK